MQSQEATVLRVPSTATDRRAAGSCPLCGRSTRTLDTFGFSPSDHLPQVVRLEYCDDCDFVFVGDLSASSYRRYYASIRNDGGHVVGADEPGSQVGLQTAHLAAALGPTFCGRVLDVGCGQGLLLHALASRFPGAALFGHDVADYLMPRPGLRFLPTIDDDGHRFDLIVLSHVAEHLVGFEIIGQLEHLLAPGGLLYVEVPDPRQYAACPRREFMYYIDRLHVNHFGPRAMARLLDRYGLEVRRSGTHRFPYRDGVYPAMYCIAGRRSGDPRREQPVGIALDRVFTDYLDTEEGRADVMRRALLDAGGSAGVLVYGAGDNFHRARRAGGPLHGVALLGVMDRRAAEMPAHDGLHVELPEVALRRHPEASVVITVSQGADGIADAIRADWPDRRIVVI